MSYDYIREPDAIYAESFRLIRDAVDLSAYGPREAKLIERLVHTNGRTDVVGRLVLNQAPVEAGVKALQRQAPILCDARMVEQGLIQRLIPRDEPSKRAQVHCLLDQIPFAEGAQDTRSAKAVELWRPLIEGAIVLIGNAPTALFRLLEMLQRGWPRPALIVAMPVGFVGAAQSKDALLRDFPEIPTIALKGREGGSAYAAAAFNAIANLALNDAADQAFK